MKRNGSRYNFGEKEAESMLGATDVIFLLLIFFIITNSIGQQQEVGIKTELPKREAAISEPTAKKSQKIVITRAGEIRLQREKIVSAGEKDWEDIYKKLFKRLDAEDKKLQDEGKKFQAQIYADNYVAWNRVAQVLSVCATLDIKFEIVYEGM
jgi:biopolymer transport protein ExbD